MNILHHMEQIRLLLADRGACEVPQYPEPLAQAWSHPDILLAARGKQPVHCFCFQTVWQRTVVAASDDASCRPALVWLMNCSEKDFTGAVIDFISDLYFAMTNSREDSGFSLVADRSDRFNSKDRGCCWQLQYNGVGCGQICLFSELFMETLARPAVFLLLDLEKLPSLLDQKNFGQPVLWTENVRAADMLALRAWQLKAGAGSREKLQNKLADRGIELCRLISDLNAGFLSFSKDEVRLQQLAADINDSVRQILVERGEGKVVAKDADK